MKKHCKLAQDRPATERERCESVTELLSGGLHSGWAGPPVSSVCVFTVLGTCVFLLESGVVGPGQGHGHFHSFPGSLVAQ